MYTKEDIINLGVFYKSQLLEDTVPFWFPKSYDYENGGYLLMRDFDGSLIDEDKAVWIQGRACWLLSTLYNTVDKKQEWLEGAKLGYEFLKNHCFDSDGRMYFHMDKKGRPIRKRRYYFSETFAVLAFAAYGKACNNSAIKQEAVTLFKKCIAYESGEVPLEPKFENTRPLKSIGPAMIMMNTAQQLREILDTREFDNYIDQWIEYIEKYFVKDDIRCVMEQVNLDGSISDHIAGRQLNPGHALEAAWFILHEAQYRNRDPHLINLGCRMIDYMWERGWDKEFGGILYFRDVYNKPVQEYWHDMKFWWPQNETIIATLLAYILSGETRYGEMHAKIHNYAYSHFHDDKHGEWYGYLQQNGKISQTAKGNLFKGPFHLPRQELYCYQLIENYIKDV